MPQNWKLPNANEDLEKIRSLEHRGLYASGGPNYKDAIFGRDSIESAEDLLDIKPELAEEVIVTMACFQGQINNPLSEEEPGRIHHEHRSLTIRGKDVELSQESKDILKKLALRWGGTEQEMTYYGSVDATPLYVRLVANYCKKFGNEILNKEAAHHTGVKVTIRQSLLDAIAWIEQRLKASDLGLLEFKRSNPLGHSNPVWKDSNTSYIHESGELANHSAPITSIEVQGLAYDALLGAAEVFKEDAKYSKNILGWQGLAHELREATIENLWMEDRQSFALGIDRDTQTGKMRRIETVSSNVGCLLDTRIFDDLQEDSKEKYVSGIVKTIYSPEFITDVGVRSRALRYLEIVDFADYHGSWAVWIKETYDIAKGLRRQGFPKLSNQLEARILNAVNIAGVNYEFYYVDKMGRVDYQPVEKTSEPVDPKTEIILAPAIPEGLQAWTISAVLAINNRRAQKQSDQKQSDWQAVLEEELLKQPGVPAVEVMSDADQIYQAFLHRHKFVIDREEGKVRSARYKAMIK